MTPCIPARVRPLALGATAVLAATIGATAPAAIAAGAADFRLQLTSAIPDSPTGLDFHVLFRRAGDGGAKPPALSSAVVHAPQGLRFDSAAVTRCTASDAELRLFGSEACPSNSQLAIGKLTGLTGFGGPIDPLVGDDHVFNGPDQIIEVITAPGTPLSPAFDRLTIKRATLRAHPPALPGGPPDGKTAIRSIDFKIPVRVARGRSLITTPPRCPASGEWLTRATFYFADNSVATAVAPSPCRKPRRPARSRQLQRHQPARR